MPQHTVVITFDPAGNPVPLNADASQIEPTRKVRNCDQIRWITPHGAVAVEFQGSTPFQDKTPADKVFGNISREGTFTYKCTVTGLDGTKHGWPKNPNGGGTVEVGR